MKDKGGNLLLYVLNCPYAIKVYNFLFPLFVMICMFWLLLLNAFVELSMVFKFFLLPLINNLVYEHKSA
jgi:hypothetical protein